MDYNDRGQLTSVVDTRDLLGERSNSGVYSYDHLGRLTGFDAPEAANDRTYGYDAWGNLTRHGDQYFTYDTALKPHQVKEVRVGDPAGTPTPIAHDDNGNRAGKPGHTYDYDKEDRLQEVEIASGQTLRFVYDAQGWETVRMVGADPAQTTRRYGPLAETTGAWLTKFYVLGDLRVALQLTSYVSWETAARDDGAIRVAAVPLARPGLVVELAREAQWGAGTAVLCVAVGLLVLPGRRRRGLGVAVRPGHALGIALATTLGLFPWPVALRPPAAEAGGTAGSYVRHYHLDHLGSTQAITDKNGALYEQIRYRPYGEVRRWLPDGTPILVPGTGRYEFTGYETEGYSGLAYAGVRFYDPAFGMFLTHDPAAQFASPYTYTDWDPINRTDPTGAVVGWIIAGFILGYLVGHIQARVNGASTGEAFKAGLIGGAIGGATAGLLGPVGASATAAGGWQAFTFWAVTLSAGAYGTAESFRSGQYVAGSVGAILLAFGAYGAYRAYAGGGAQPAGGGGGATNERDGVTLREMEELYGAEIEPAQYTPSQQPNASPAANTDPLGLKPAFRERVDRVLIELEQEGWEPRIAEGLRTPGQQAEKYRLGFSPSATRSAHLRGYGADVIDRRWGWGGPAANKDFRFWHELAAAARRNDLTTGRFFPNKDVAHVEMPGWQRLP